MDTISKMQNIAEIAKKQLSATFLVVHASDNIMSAVNIRGSHDKEKTWSNNIFENSRYFAFLITPAKNKRYYINGESVTVELLHKDYLITERFRKSTTTPEKAVERIATWIKKTAQ